MSIIARRALLGSAGLLGLIGSAQAATPTFEDVLYKAAGAVASAGTTARTSAQRAGDFINVKDYGAKGDGVTDDTAAIQAAINARGTTPSSAVVNNPSARIYFPTGTYKVTKQGTSGVSGYGYALYFDNVASGLLGTVFFGDGPSSNITGNVAGFLFLTDGPGAGGPTGFRDLGLYNSNTTYPSGCIALVGGASCSFVEDCNLTGFNCVDFSLNNTSGTEQPHVSGCIFASSAAATAGGSPGSWGIACTNATTVIGCGFTGFGGIGAILTTNVACAIIGCRFEVNLIGINCGILGNAGNNGGPAIFIGGCSFEDNGTAIKVSAAGQMQISSISIQGENATLASAYGVDLRGSSGGILLQGATIGGYFTGNAIILADNDCTTTIMGVLPNVTAGGGANYSGGYGSTFIGCKNLTVNAKTFANAPAAPVIGTEVAISDSNTNTAFATIAGSGANHVIGRWNGTNWIVVGVY